MRKEWTLWVGQKQALLLAGAWVHAGAMAWVGGCRCGCGWWRCSVLEFCVGYLRTFQGVKPRRLPDVQISGACRELVMGFICL